MAVGPLIYAHRLGREPGPDSSRAALAATLAAGGADGLETDVCLTADGRLALLHDPWLAHATTLAGWAHETAWGTISTARLLDRHGDPTDETPMLLEELLDATPGHLVVQVEVKAHADPYLARRTASAVAGVVAGRTDRDRVEVLSFHADACEQAAAEGLRARLIIWADYEPAALAAWARRTGVRGVCVEHFLLRVGLVERLREAGLSVTTGTINDAALAGPALALGVDAITSDRPAALRRELARAARFAVAA